jgi:hypothetical protein
MLSICRMVSTDDGRNELRPLEQYRDVDFPSTGPLQATDQQKAVLDDALKAIFLQDHGLSNGAQIVLVSSRGRIVAIENFKGRGTANRLTWIDLPLVVSLQSPAGSQELPTFMCEEQVTHSDDMNPHCFEVTDSRGRSWTVYQVREGLVDCCETPAMNGIQVCEREDLADRLGRA